MVTGPKKMLTTQPASEAAIDAASQAAWNPASWPASQPAQLSTTQLSPDGCSLQPSSALCPAEAVLTSQPDQPRPAF